MNFDGAPFVKFVAVLILALSIAPVANAAVPEPADRASNLAASSESNSFALQTVADRVGLGKEFQALAAARKQGDEAQVLFLEGRFLRHLWMAEFEVNRIVARIDEERTVVSEAISNIENRKQRIVGTINSVNFLSTGIISTVGNAIFIPAPPPRPVVPNILFTVAGGIDTTLSMAALTELRGGKSKLSMHSESVLAPLFVKTFEPEYSKLLWHYFADENAVTGSTPKEMMVSKWVERKVIPPPDSQAGRQRILELLGKGRDKGVVTLHDLELRQQMLSDLEVCVIQLSKEIAKLARSL